MLFANLTKVQFFYGFFIDHLYNNFCLKLYLYAFLMLMTVQTIFAITGVLILKDIFRVVSAIKLAVIAYFLVFIFAEDYYSSKTAYNFVIYMEVAFE